MFTSSDMVFENACTLQSWEKYYFSKQNITTSNVLQILKHFGTNFVILIFIHFLKAENSVQSLASSCEDSVAFM